MVVKQLIVMFSAIAAVWLFAVGVSWAQTSANDQGHIVVTTGTVYMLLCICAVIVPLTVYVAKLGFQVNQLQKEIARADARNEDLIEKGVEVGERIARGMETLAGNNGAGRISDPDGRRRGF